MTTTYNAIFGQKIKATYHGVPISGVTGSKFIGFRETVIKYGPKSHDCTTKTVTQVEVVLDAPTEIYQVVRTSILIEFIQMNGGSEIYGNSYEDVVFGEGHDPIHLWEYNPFRFQGEVYMEYCDGQSRVQWGRWLWNEEAQQFQGELSNQSEPSVMTKDHMRQIWSRVKMAGATMRKRIEKEDGTREWVDC